MIADVYWCRTYNRISSSKPWATRWVQHAEQDQPSLLENIVFGGVLVLVFIVAFCWLLFVSWSFKILSHGVVRLLFLLMSLNVSLFISFFSDRPKIVTPPQTAVIMVGLSHKFTCMSTGHPKPSIAWSFESVSLQVVIYKVAVC